MTNQSPRSKNLTSLIPRPRSLDNIRIGAWHITGASFISAFILSYLFIFAFQPRFLFSDHDFLDQDSSNEAGVSGDGNKKKNNKIFSDRGRQISLLWALITAIILSIAVWFALKFGYHRL